MISLGLVGKSPTIFPFNGKSILGDKNNIVLFATSVFAESPRVAGLKGWMWLFERNGKRKGLEGD